MTNRDTTRRDIANGARNVAIRIGNAESSFIDFAARQATLPRADAVRVLAYYRRIKAIKIDAIGGQWSLTHGAFADADTLRRAADLTRR